MYSRNNACSWKCYATWCQHCLIHFNIKSSNYIYSPMINWTNYVIHYTLAVLKISQIFICTWLNVWCTLRSVSSQLNRTFSLDQGGEDILKAVNVYEKTPWENQSNGKLMVFQSHHSVLGCLCDYESAVGVNMHIFLSMCMFTHYFLMRCFKVRGTCRRTDGTAAEMWSSVRYQYASNIRSGDWIFNI